MLQRCENPGNKAFHNYGGRGVMVSKEWHSYEAFLADMGPSYAAGLQIERRNNDGHYSKSNCCWATGKINCRNQRKTVRVEWNGESVALADLAEQHGVKLHTAYSRYRLKGWSLRRSLGLQD